MALDFFRMFKTFLVACGATGLLAGSVSAAAISGSCTPTKTQFVASTLADSTTISSSFVNVPQATVTFTQGGNSPSCVLVRFTATTYTQDAIDALAIRALMDGTTAGMPSELT